MAESIKRFAVFDIDGTLIRWQLYHALADALAKSGHIDGKTYRSMQNARMVWKRREYSNSFKDYEFQIIKSFEAALKVLEPKQLTEAANAVFNEYKDQTYSYTRDLIKHLKAERYLLFAISGSQIEIVQQIAEYYGFDDFIGTIYTQKAGKFTGEKILASADKAAALRKLIVNHQVSLEKSIAVGDSAGDISMMQMVERPIAFNPDSKLFTHATKVGWEVVVERKNVIYKLVNENGKYILAETNTK